MHLENKMRTAAEILTSHNKFHITLGLERIQNIMNLLDNPQDKYEIIHIAGTNGKGSTSKILNEILIENFPNKKIGLFTSPHLFSYTERIQINNEEISQYILDKLTNDINNLASKNNIELSEFELITAVAFYYFFIKGCDYVVLETGLGGMFDATNIVKSKYQIITTIDFDHTERLGKTIEEIALQKAGIIKNNSKIAISEKNQGFKTIKKTIEEKKSKLLPLKNIQIVFKNNENFALIDKEEYNFNLLGQHQSENLSLALAIAQDLNVDKKAIKTALKKVSWRFRLEYHKKENILIDGAHNPSGIKTLTSFLKDNFKEEKIIIFGCLKNKNYSKMLNTLINNKDKFFFFEFNYPNALKFDDLDETFKSKMKKITSIEEIKPLLKKPELKVFCGSLYMLGEIFKQIRLD